MLSEYVPIYDQYDQDSKRRFNHLIFSKKRNQVTKVRTPGSSGSALATLFITVLFLQQLNTSSATFCSIVLQK